ncbi:GUN4 domain-containing protein [Dapis sp. BLCC M172]|uniref:GUN4 domain-containing protein n=1 Tax=Dapis sp. BLCC M172 TaxID=2975281 RepID=UPI003CF6C1B5
MKFLPRIFALIFLALTLTNCSRELSSEKIASRLEPSLVKISSRNKPEHITGFFVSGKTDVCTVVTTANFVKKDGETILRTNDEKVWDISSVKIFPSNIDLALVTFQPEGKKCNYPVLKIGNYENMKIGSSIYISGLPMESEELLPKFVSGTVSSLAQLADGYGVYYKVLNIDGMSGSPVVDVRGEVVAVHGMSDLEIIQSLESEKASLYDAQKATFQQIVERIETYDRLNTFHWGIPINLFQEYRGKAVPHYVPLVSEAGLDYTKLRDLLVAGNWEEADKETSTLILKLTGQVWERSVEREDLNNLSCKDLSTIDKLWLKYSNGQFGFSVQQKIYDSVSGGWYVWKAYQLGGATKEYYKRYKSAFIEKVGWRKAGKWNLVWESVNPNTPYLGHIPFRAVMGASEQMLPAERIKLFFSRVDACRL